MKKISALLFALLISTLGFGQFTLMDSLKVHYMFSGNAADSSGNGYDGTINGATLTTDRFAAANSAYDFNGTSGFIQIPDTPYIKPDFPFTLSLWFTIDSFSANPRVLYASDSQNGSYSGFWISYNPTGELGAGYGDAQGTGSGNRVSKLSDSPVIDTTGWYNLIVSYNSLNDIDIYIDCIEIQGTYSGTASAMVDLGFNGAVGKRMTVFNDFHIGKIDDIRLYHRTLDATIRDSLCNEGIVGIFNENQQRTISISPNPTNGKFTVSSRQGAIKKVEVFDLFGRKVLESKEPEIDMSNYPAGLYIWRVGEVRGKVVIE